MYSHITIHSMDMNDPILKGELQRLQEKNIEDTKKFGKYSQNFICQKFPAKAESFQPQPAQSESRYEKLRLRKYSKGTSKTGASTQKSLNWIAIIHFLASSFCKGNIFSKAISGSKNILNNDSSVKSSNPRVKEELEQTMRMGRCFVVFMMFVLFGYLMMNERSPAQDIIDLKNQDA